MSPNINISLWKCVDRGGLRNTHLAVWLKSLLFTPHMEHRNFEALFDTLNNKHKPLKQ